MTAICLDKDVVRLAVFLASYDQSTLCDVIDYFVNDRRPSDFERSKRNVVRGYVTRFRSYCRNDRFIVKVLTLVRDLVNRGMVKTVIKYNDGSIFCSLCGRVISRVDPKDFRLAAAEHLWEIHRDYILDTVEYVYSYLSY
jgi:hypothetical protein